MPPERAAEPSRIVTIGGPLGLVLGVIVALVAREKEFAFLLDAVRYIEPVGQLWMNALRVSVLPLIVSLLVCGVTTFPRTAGIGRAGTRMFAWFVGLLLCGAAYSLIVTGAYVRAVPPKLTLGSETPATIQEASNGSWTEAIVPSNFVAAVAVGEILPIAILSVVFGLALRTLSAERRKPVEDLFLGVRDALMVYVRWVMYGVPLGAFALMYVTTLESGLETAGTLASFVVFVSLALLIAALALWLAVTVLLRMKVKDSTKLFLPLASVAVGTRSSFASLPALFASSRAAGLQEDAAELVLPTAVGTFKLNRTISSTAKMLFMATATGVVLGPHAVLTFIGTVVLLSFATPGLPSGNGSMTMGAYLAVGIPIEAVVIFDAVDAPSDFAKTLLNVVADFAVAVFVSENVRKTRTSPLQTPEAACEELAG